MEVHDAFRFLGAALTIIAASAVAAAWVDEHLRSDRGTLPLTESHRFWLALLIYFCAGSYTFAEQVEAITRSFGCVRQAAAGPSFLPIANAPDIACDIALPIAVSIFLHVGALIALAALVYLWQRYRAPREID